MNETVLKLGWYSGLTASFFTVAFVIVQLLQVIGVLTFPVDEILIYSTSLGIVIPFLLEILSLHHITDDSKKIWSHAALIFSVIYSVFVTANYVVQLSTVIPMEINGTSESIEILKQTPHSLFWDFDAIGYLSMGFATLIAVPVFKKTGFERLVRISFLANGFVNFLIGIVYFYPNFSAGLYILGWPWGITAPLSMFLLALLFRKRWKNSNES
jgi:hypothetical protein